MNFSLDPSIESRLDQLPEFEPHPSHQCTPLAWTISSDESGGLQQISIRELPHQEAALPISDLSATCTHVVTTQLGEIECSGSALLGQCPQCSAPMTIRLWLRLADCWKCPASVSLNEITIREIKKAIPQSPTLKPRQIRLPAPPPSLESFSSQDRLESLTAKEPAVSQNRLPLPAPPPAPESFNTQVQTIERKRTQLPEPPPTPEQFSTRAPLQTVAPKFKKQPQIENQFWTVTDDMSELEVLTERSPLARLLGRLFGSQSEDWDYP